MPIIPTSTTAAIRPRNPPPPRNDRFSDRLLREPPPTTKVVSFHDLALAPLQGHPPSATCSDETQATDMNEPPADFRALYDTHFDFVWRSLRRLGVREPDVLDLAQKVFLTAYVKLPEFEGRSLVSTWLFGIAQRVASDYRRSALVRREISTDDAELAVVAFEDQDFSTETDARRRARTAEAILNKLPEPQRTVFVLFELEEMSGQDIATLLNISVGTVRSRLRLARDAFRREVKRLSASKAGGRKEAV
jgi:RNA polymerase sigma-70 factor, ECF subfamily